ncbi:AfsR/SARP family transcriptional regulator [Nocardioides sp. MAHUQ-72]|uniref:AfsR/SARP family transcriptional regulator n=1 Tax=unclassified Nocardioides TaxID=2615069 RepID=UPI00361DD055
MGAAVAGPTRAGCRVRVMRVRVRLLGRFEVVVDGRPVPAPSWRRQSASRLVKLLALQPSYRLHRDQVIDALWPDVPADTGSTRLHTAAHYARAALGEPRSIVVAQGVVALFPDADVEVDVTAFEQAAGAARGAQDAQHATAAAALYAGTLLPEDVYEPWTEEPRGRLRLQHREVLRAAGQYDALVADDPLDEDAQIEMVRDLLRQGRRHDAIESLDRMAQVLERELGVEPSEAARQLRAEAEAMPAGAGTAGGSRPARAVLPAARNRLIGRSRDLDDLAGLLSRHRVVTITGPGGVGKSTLALAHARAVQSADGSEAEVVLAELAPVREAGEVTRAVAEAVGVQGEGAVRAPVLAATLGRRPVLLVLDNCEHLLDESAALVDAILDAGDAARVLVTSREPLRVDGEAVHRLGSLGSGAAELFVDRAAAAAGADVAEVDDPRVALLCARLDGLPLAIELAAAQLRHLSLDDLVRRLDDRLTLLAGGRPRAGARHSALSATIDWSYRLLSGRDRDVFDRLGVFPSTFDLDAVVAVSGAPDTAVVTNVVGDLVAKSLVVHERSSGRYRLLETIRLFAAQRLAESGRHAEVVELLRRHVVDRASATSRTGAWLSTSLAARSRDDLDNVRLAFEASLDRGDLSGAVDVALGISMLWRNAVSYAEGRRWVGELLASDLADRDRLWALLLSADVALGAGDPRTMRAAATRAARLAERVDDPGASVVVLVYEALVHLDDPARATRRLEAAGRLARDIGEPGLARLARGYRLVTLRMQGPCEGLADEAHDVVETVGARDYDRYLCHWAASLLALVERDAPLLRRLMDAQLRDLAATGLRENWLTMYWSALALVVEGEDYVDQLRRSRARAEAEGRVADADCVLALACAAARRDDWEEAAELVGAAAGRLMDDTAGFFHLMLVRDQMVRPRLDPEVFAAATARGARSDVAAILAAHGL